VVGAALAESEGEGFGPWVRAPYLAAKGEGLHSAAGFARCPPVHRERNEK